MSSPPRFLLLMAAALSLALPTFAEKPKFATVDVAQAFEAYHVTIEEKTKIQEQRRKLKRDPRLEKIKLLKVELLELRDDVRDATLAEADRQDNFRKFQMKDQDLRALQRETLEHLDEQAKLIDHAMVKKTQNILGEVRAAVQKIAADRGFDYVFESTGKTSSQIPTLIYIRNATDITDLVIAALNDGKTTEKDIATLRPPRP